MITKRPIIFFGQSLESTSQVWARRQIANRQSATDEDMPRAGSCKTTNVPTLIVAQLTPDGFKLQLLEAVELF